MITSIQCPLCGERDADLNTFQQIPDYGNTHQVTCNSCGASGSMFNEKRPDGNFSASSCDGDALKQWLRIEV